MPRKHWKCLTIAAYDSDGDAVVKDRFGFKVTVAKHGSADIIVRPRRLLLARRTFRSGIEARAFMETGTDYVQCGSIFSVGSKIWFDGALRGTADDGNDRIVFHGEIFRQQAARGRVVGLSQCDFLMAHILGLERDVVANVNNGDKNTDSVGASLGERTRRNCMFRTRVYITPWGTARMQF